MEAASNAAKADKALNQAYRELLATLDPDGAKLLKESQRAWIAYRDAEAKFAADEARGGSMAPMLFSGALGYLTDERTKHLKQRMGGQETPAEPEAKPQPKPKTEESVTTKDERGAKTQLQAGQAFFEAFKAHDRKTAQKFAADTALNKLVWDPASGDNPTLKLMDATHIYYEGGSIQLKMQKTKAGRWIVGDVGVTAD
ncbi:MAG: hypothetical protein JWO08_4114 [Verrucomicrobiaceae bacterium]|nr:hypothetical protein [Verrucomicrobiaceae bacterium]